MTGILLATNESTIPLSRAEQPDRPLAGLTVMVVEDSRVASEAVRLLCLRSGARIRRADCLRAAARHLQTYRPGVMVVDMGLPDGQGADLIAQMSRQRPDAPVLLGMSADPDTRAAAMAAGADGFLLKPIESLHHFQRAILSVLPRPVPPPVCRIAPADPGSPDGAALRDDLTHVAEVLSAASDTSSIDYIVRFLAGVARTARDEPLAEAATALARDHSSGRALAADLARISGLVQERLAMPAARVGR